MVKKRRMFKLFLIFLQISLIVSVSFVGAFYLSEFVGIVSARESPYSRPLPPATNNPPEIFDPDILELTKSSGTVESAAAKELKIPLLGKFTGGPAHLLEGAFWALTVAGAIQLIGGIAGLESEQTNAASLAAIAGIMTYKGLASLGPSGFNFITNSQNFFLQNAGLIGIGVAVATFVLLYKKEEKKVVQFQCLPWEAPLGGSACEECNNDPSKPCSEYRCRSLGQACQLVNEGTEEESCVWVSPQDVKSPLITPLDSALTDELSYANHDTRPPSLGTNIVRGQDGCVQAFTPLSFGITTNEPAQCKIDFISTNNFEDMAFFMGDNNFFLQNHTQQLSLPSPDAVVSEGLVLENDGSFDFYVRCQDANGNENTDEFVFSFCVDPSPDTTPPIIVDTSIKDGSPVSFGSENVDVSLFLNEPAECRWSIQDKDFDSMENEASCSNSVVNQNAQQLYTCSTTLTGIKDRAENNFFFRCKDLPSKPDNERNVNTQSFELALLGSQPLNIISALPNETITGSTESVKIDLEVETSNGAKEGEAICYFSPTGDEGSFVKMFETESFAHKQTLSLTAGNYDYSFRCIDAGGNADETDVSFSVLTDKNSPLITRAYKEGTDSLKIVTNEDAECAYSLNSCNFNFDEGIKFLNSNPSITNIHFAEWNSNSVYYIKCRDEFGNQPGPNQCSLIAGASNVF